MLYLGGSDIELAATPVEVMAAIERAYRIQQAGTYDLPQRIHVDHGVNTLLYMPCFTASYFGTKLLTLFPGNAAKQLPVIEGLMLLNDAATGRPLALLNGAKLTAVRTGGVGGVGIRHTSPEQASRVGLIGAGVQGLQQLIFAAAARPLQQILVYDRDRQRTQDFVGRLQAVLPQVGVAAAASPAALLAASEIVITTTNATAPVLPDCEQQLRGKHFIGIGSYQPTMREYPEAIYRLLPEVLVDTEHGLSESGDLILPLERGWLRREQVVTFGRYLAERQSGERPLAETSLFKSVGMALFDLVVAELVYEQALERGLGQEIAY